MAQIAFGVGQLDIGALELRENAGNLELDGVALLTAGSISSSTASSGVKKVGDDFQVALPSVLDTAEITGSTDSNYDGVYSRVGLGGFLDTSGTTFDVDSAANSVTGVWSKSDGAGGYHIISRDMTQYFMAKSATDPSTFVDNTSYTLTDAEILGSSSEFTTTTSGFRVHNSATVVDAGESQLAIVGDELVINLSTDTDFANDTSKLSTRGVIDTFVTAEIAAITAADISLGNVDNTADADKPVSTAQQTALDLKIDAADKGVANGVASLDGSGLVPSAQLPSYVDDVLEYADEASFPGTGEAGKIYVAIDNNTTHRWSGSVYVEIASGTIADGEITTAKLAADAVDSTKLADDSVDSEHLVDGSIDTAHVADNAVTEDKIADAVVARLPIHSTNASAGSTQFSLSTVDMSTKHFVEWFVQANDGTDSESMKVVADEAGNYSSYAHLGNGNVAGFDVVVDKVVDDVRLRCTSTADVEWNVVTICV